MAQGTRLKVLSIFKKLHRAKNDVFWGDNKALEAGRNKIRQEFAKHKNISDPQKIGELLKVAHESEEMLRTQVVQLSQERENVFRFRGDHLINKCNIRQRCDNCTCGM